MHWVLPRDLRAGPRPDRPNKTHTYTNTDTPTDWFFEVRRRVSEGEKLALALLRVGEVTPWDAGFVEF